MPVRVTMNSLRVTEAGEDGRDRNAEWHMDFVVEGGGFPLTARTINPPGVDRDANAVIDNESLIDDILVTTTPQRTPMPVTPTIAPGPARPTFVLPGVDPGDEVILEAQGVERDGALGGRDDDPLPSSFITVEMPATPFEDLNIETFERNAGFGYELSWNIDFFI